ncbi:MAG: hypothetical protein LUC86_09270 [Prevotellaceae bacterium]|nr:hypothetical protein [Prevotellaceae bacterium]
MKKVLSSLCLCLAALFAVTSCTRQNKERELLGQIPDDVDMVVEGDVRAILESAGFKVDGQAVQFPAYVKDALDEDAAREAEELRAFLKRSGVELEACAVAMYYKDEHPVVVLSLSDAGKFRKAIKGEGFELEQESEGVEYYKKLVFESTYDPSYNDYGYVALSGQYAYWIDRVWAGGSGLDPIKALGRMVSEAKQSPFSKTGYAKYISSGNAAGAAFRIPQGVRRDMRDKGFPLRLVEALDGVLCLKADISEGEARLSMSFYGEDGSPKKAEDLAPSLDLGAKVNPEALKYMNADESLVCALSLKGVDWDDCLSTMAAVAELDRGQQAMLAAVASCLGELEGTVAVGIGLNSLSPSWESNVPVTLVCETKEGKAEELLGDLKAMLEALGVDYEGTSSGLALSLPRVGKLYAEAEGDVLVFSNRSISKAGGNPTVQSVDFGGSIGTAAIVLGKESPLLSDLGLDEGLRLTCSSDAEAQETSLVLAMDGDEGTGIVERIARACLQLASRAYEMQGVTDEDDDFYPAD